MPYDLGFELTLYYSQLIVSLSAKRPEMYLEEFRDELREVYGIDVSGPTIWRVLHRNDLTMKQASTY